jgi:hypothetical protein
VATDHVHGISRRVRVACRVRVRLGALTHAHRQIRSAGGRQGRRLSHGYEQHAAGRRGRGGQAVQEQVARGRDIAQFPQQQGVVPGEVAGGVDGSAGDEVADRLQVVIGGELRRGLERLADRLLGRIQQLVHLLVVGQMGAPRPGRSPAVRRC